MSLFVLCPCVASFHPFNFLCGCFFCVCPFSVLFSQFVVVLWFIPLTFFFSTVALSNVILLSVINSNYTVLGLAPNSPRNRFRLKNKNKHTKANSNAITNQTEYEHRTQFTQSHLQSIIYTCTSITRFSPYMVCTTLPKKQGFFKQQTVHH